jgi:serine protease Do
MHARIVPLAALAVLLGATLGVRAQTAQPATTPPQAIRPYLGILAVPAPPGAAQAGVFVREVTPDSPAAKAGLKAGDEITKVGDKSVNSFTDLVTTLNQHKPGEKLTFHVRREGKEQSLNVTLGEQRQPGSPRRVPAFLGVATRVLTAEEKQRLGSTAKGGVAVVQVVPNTPAARAGVRAGDVITDLNSQAVTSPEQLRELVAQAANTREIKLSVQRGKETQQIKIGLD